MSELEKTKKELAALQRKHDELLRYKIHREIIDRELARPYRPFNRELH